MTEITSDLNIFCVALGAAVLVYMGIIIRQVRDVACQLRQASHNLQWIEDYRRSLLHEDEKLRDERRVYAYKDNQLEKCQNLRKIYLKQNKQLVEELNETKEILEQIAEELNGEHRAVRKITAIKTIMMAGDDEEDKEETQFDEDEVVDEESGSGVDEVVDEDDESGSGVDESGSVVEKGGRVVEKGGRVVESSTDLEEDIEVGNFKKNGFIMFCKCFRPILQKNYPSESSIEITKRLSLLWKAKAPEEKREWNGR